MNVAESSGQHARLERIQQTVKWTVYTLLLFNFVFYIYEDVTRAAFTLHSESTWFDWTSAFATSFDMFAWLMLLLMFELETYVFENDNHNEKLTRLVHAIRIVCYLVIFHTVVAFTNTVIDYSKTTPVEGVSSLCDLAGQDLSYVYNLSYTGITVENCAELSNETEFFMVGADPVVSDMPGLTLERQLAMADIAEALIWLMILLAIEIIVRLQNRDITEGHWIRALWTSKMAGYITLLAISVWWASLTHWVYLWDQLLWIGGFAVIDMNIRQWRDEIWADEELAEAQAQARAKEKTA